MKIKKRYLFSIIITIFLSACGNQEYKRGEIKLIQKAPHQNTLKHSLEKNSTQNITQKESNSPSNNIVKSEDNNTNDLYDNLAELREIIKKELFLLNSDKKNIDAEMNISKSKILADKEIALAKLNTNKELSNIELEKKQQIELAKIKASKDIAIAKLQYEKNISNNQKNVDLSKQIHSKEVEIAKLKTQEAISQNKEKVEIAKLSKEKEIELAKLENQKELTNKDIAFKKIILFIITGIVLFIILIVYLINKRKRDNELKIHKSEIKHKEYMEATKQHNENMRKMLEIIIDDKTDKELKKDMVKLLKEEGKKGRMIEHKK